MKFTLLADLQDVAGFTGEFGLSLQIEYSGEKFLFDTGADDAFLLNSAKLGLDVSRLPVILSHGHYDHSGGLQYLSPALIRCVRSVDCGHYSCHADGTVHYISMPFASQRVLHDGNVFAVDDFSAVGNGLYLTGPIPRNSGEDCGGNFFHDAQCLTPDEIPDEQALLSSGGILVTGCCHAGIINTMEFCRTAHPEIKIHSIVGGLHLCHAGEKRLHRTAEYLKEAGVKQLYLLHCTGENAIRFLQHNLPECRIFTPALGEIWEIADSGEER
ncbi:MAG: MBL fold metallo-hydrolase [Lentisphaeria bacterium]|nr:MBL fold metallo-hydrolase [Lentisphaeria bacterium]